MVVHCDTQAEIDRLWNVLIAKIGKGVQCGWLKDRYGLSWQIVSSRMREMMKDTDQAKADRVMAAVMTMVKLDSAKLEAAQGRMKTGRDPAGARNRRFCEAARVTVANSACRVDQVCGGFPMNAPSDQVTWMAVAILIARLIFAGLFIMAATFKFIGMDGTASYIAAAGFPFPLLLAWLAALFETALGICLLSGAYFSEAALLAAAYVLFLAFAFHGPAHWSGNQTEFGSFIDHFTFIAGLLFAAVHGPGRMLAIRRSFLSND